MRGGVCTARHDSTLTAAIGAFAVSHGTTPYVTLLTAFCVLLHRYAGQRDLVVGVPMAGRRRPELASVIGYFANTLPVRVAVGGVPSFAELVANVRRSVLGAMAHQAFPLARIVERVSPARDGSRVALFQAVCVYHKARSDSREGLARFGLGEAGARIDHGGLDVEAIPLARRSVEFDVVLIATDLGGELALSLEYDADLFDPDTAARMLQHLGALLPAAIARPEVPVSMLSFMADDERSRMIGAWNATTAPFEDGACAHELLDAQAMRTPDAVSVACEGDSALTFSALAARANQLAHHLRRLGIRPETRVGVCLARSNALVIAVLAVMKAGGAYVPLDPTYPRERLAFMVEDAGVRCVITDLHDTARGRHAMPRSARRGTGVGGSPRVARCGGDHERHPSSATARRAPRREPAMPRDARRRR
jgi:non-ribosomal peptide synthetase component F